MLCEKGANAFAKCIELCQPAHANMGQNFLLFLKLSACKKTLLHYVSFGYLTLYFKDTHCDASTTDNF